MENQSQPTPGPLRSFLLGLSRLCLLWGSFSGTSPESLLVVWPPGLLWLALAPSFLSLSPVTRNKEEIRLWGLSGASVWASPSSVFSGLLWLARALSFLSVLL